MIWLKNNDNSTQEGRDEPAARRDRNDLDINTIALDVVMATLSDLAPQRYCGSKKGRLKHATVNKAPKTKRGVEVGQSSRTPPMLESNDAFLTFDPQCDVQAPQFFALSCV